MKRQFEIEFPDDPKTLDVTARDLDGCIKTKCHIDPFLARDVVVRDITDYVADIEKEADDNFYDRVDEPSPSEAPVYPSEDAFRELHGLLDRAHCDDNVHTAVEDWLYEYVFVECPDPPEESSEEYPYTPYGAKLTPDPSLLNKEDKWDALQPWALSFFNGCLGALHGRLFFFRLP